MRRIAASVIALLALVPTLVAAQTAYTSEMRYDSNRRVTGAIDADPDGPGGNGYPAVRNSYDAGGRLIKVETGVLAAWQPVGIAPASWSGFTVHTAVEATYDNQHRKTREIKRGSDGVAVSLVQFSYDLVGRPECTAERMNPAAYGSLPPSACTLGTEGSFGPDRITKNIYDPAGRLIKIQKALGVTGLQEDYATYTYSPNGKRTSLTDARGYKASMTYDGFDRQIKWNFPSTTTPATVSTTDYEEYGYDANGNRTSVRKRDGSVLTYGYDALNRVTKKIVPDCASPLCSGLASTHTRDVHFGYDLRGLQLFARFDSAAAGSEGVTAVYDGFGRRTSSAFLMGGTTRTLAYTHDKNGNRTELTWPDSAKTSYVYDGIDRLTALRQGGLASGTTMASFYYNQRGLRDYWATLANDHDVQGYDPAGRLSALSHNYIGGTGTVNFTYGYTPGMQLASQSRDNDAYAWTGHYNVDRAYVVNGLNQYIAAGGANFCYDAKGNLVADGARVYRYDVENRLVEARAQLSATCPNPVTGTGYGGALAAQLRYDPLGRLYEVIGGGSTTTFLHDGDELVAEYNGAATLLRRYAHGVGVDDPMLWYEGASLTNPRSLHADHQGSVIGIATSSGTQFGKNSYDEYGIPAATNQGRFQYTGQAWVPELGMYYYKARIYSPTLGRFMQTDPIGYDDQINLYAYVAGDPVNNTDPDGQECQAQTGSRVCRTPVDNRDPMWRIFTPGEGQIAEFRRRGQPYRGGPVTGVPRLPRGGVRGSDAAGGHVNRVHVGRSVKQMRERLQRTPSLERTSTFDNPGIANSVMKQAVRENAASIRGWLNFQGGVGQHVIRYEAPIAVGTVVPRGGAAYRSNEVYIILRSNNNIINNSHDIYVHTAFVGPL